MNLNPETAPPADDAQPPADTSPTAPTKELSVSQKSIALVRTTLKEFDGVEAGLARLKKKYEGVVFNVSTTKGMKEATDARMAIREPRYAVKNALDAAKKPLNELKADITARAEQITTAILALETPVHEQIVAEEKRKAAKKEAREAADRVRILAITERIGAIRATAARAGECRTAARVNDILTSLMAVDMTGFDEFENEAVAALTAATETVTKIHIAKVADEAEREARRVAQEAEDARLKEEAEKLAAERAEFQRQQEAFAAQQAAAAQAALDRLAAAEAKLPANPTPEQAPAVDLVKDLVSLGREIGVDLVGTCCEKGPAGGVCTECAETSAGYSAGMRVVRDADLVDTAAVVAGFDVAMAVPLPSTVQHDGTPFSFTDDELMTVAIDAVSGYFGISEQAAIARLSSITQWLYEGHAIAA